jgi:hypothetical protein
MKRSTLYFFVFVAGLLILTTKKLIRGASGLGFEWGWISVLVVATLGLIIFALKYHKDVDSDLEVGNNNSMSDEKERNDAQASKKQKPNKSEMATPRKPSV